MIDFATAELTAPTLPIAKGSGDSAAVTRLQEWLVVRGYRVFETAPDAPGINGVYGDRVDIAVGQFASDMGLSATVDDALWTALTDPMRTAFAFNPGAVPFGEAVALIAEAHLKGVPVEARQMVNAALVGTTLSGPWVRAYAGAAGQSWRAGFVAAIVRQAAAALDVTPSFALDRESAPLDLPGIASNAAAANLLQPGDITVRPPRGAIYFGFDGETCVDAAIVTGWQGTRALVIGGASDEEGGAGWRVTLSARLMTGAKWARLA